MYFIAKSIILLVLKNVDKYKNVDIFVHLRVKRLVCTNSDSMLITIGTKDTYFSHAFAINRVTSN